MQIAIIEFALKNHSIYSRQCAKYMVQLLNVHLFLDPRRIGSGFLKIDSVFLKIGVHVCRNYHYYIHSHYHYHCVVMVVFMVWAESQALCCYDILIMRFSFWGLKAQRPKVRKATKAKSTGLNEPAHCPSLRRDSFLFPLDGTITLSLR